MLRVVIIGYGTMFTNLIAGAFDANCNIVGVLRYEMTKYSPLIRKIKDCICPSLDYNYIKSYNLPELHTKSVNSAEFKKALLKLNPDIILVGSWGEKISKEIYSLPKIAAINAHPSLLPKYRGPNPYFWVIKNAEKTTGVSFHLLDKSYDTGAILAQEEIKIYPSDTGKTLKERTVLTARGVVCELLKDLSEDIIIPLTQNEEKASYYSYPKDLCLHFNKTAEENYAKIRAIHDWGKTYFFHEKNSFYVRYEGAEVIENETKYTKIGTVVNTIPEKDMIDILCGDNKVLRIKIEHSKKILKPFTKNYIKTTIPIGTSLID